MEFIMTYGWAILVVLVVIGALVYFGVLSPSTILGGRCTFPSKMGCVSEALIDSTANQITMSLINNVGFTITFTYGSPPYYSVVIRDDIGIHFTKVENRSIRIQPNQLFIFVYDVNAVYHEFKQKGVADMQEPANRDYGMRDFDLFDLNGHRITFGKNI